MPLRAEEGPPDDAPAAEEADHSSHRLIVFGEVFGNWEFSERDESAFNEFRIDRAEFGLGWRFPVEAGFFVRMETIRSAGPDSLFGIAGNSIIPRLKEGYAFYEPKVWRGEVTARVGLIPDIWVQTLLDRYQLRAASPLASERNQFFARSDVGASVGYEILDGLVAARVAVTNGEGRARVERNNGKNTTAVVSVSPVDFELFDQPAEFAAHVMGRDGSTGVDSTRNHRVAGALTLDNPRLSAGVEFARAWGLADRPGLDAVTLGGWVRGEPVEQWLGLYGRFDHTNRGPQGDLTLGGETAVDALVAGAYSTIARTDEGAGRLRILLNYRRNNFGERAGVIPGDPASSNVQAAMLTVEATALQEIAIDDIGDD
jgi:hypothetical protein